MVTVDVPLGPALTEEQAREIFAQGEEAVVFALLTLAKLAAGSNPASDSNSPSAPSGMKPPYLKPSATGKRNKKPGQKPGHVGTRRPKPPPERIDAREEHRADHCPDCGGPLNRCAETRQRYIEDIPRDIQPVVTEHVIHRDWCPQCQKKVEPAVPDALRGSPLGHRVLVLTAWLHYALGNTLAQIVDVLGFHLQFRLTRGGLLQMWYRLQGVLFPWYEQIQREALDSAVLHADETGWRVNGKTHWLWCFTTTRLTYYMIHRSRGHPALLEFFTTEFAGILVSDFWALTTRWPAHCGRPAWFTCCATSNRWRSTSRRRTTGRTLRSRCAASWATRSGFGGSAPNCRSKRMPRAANGWGNACKR